MTPDPLTARDEGRLALVLVLGCALIGCGLHLVR